MISLKLSHLVDDIYLELLSCAQENIIAVAIDCAIYFHNFKRSGFSLDDSSRRKRCHQLAMVYDVHAVRVHTIESMLTSPQAHKVELWNAESLCWSVRCDAVKAAWAVLLGRQKYVFRMLQWYDLRYDTGVGTKYVDHNDFCFHA